MSFRNLESQLARWLEQIQQYVFEIIYRKGSLRSNADVYPDDLVRGIIVIIAVNKS